MTTPVPTRKLLKQFLDDLNEERLKEFQWYLVQIQIDGSRPILRSKLENATRLTTVDKLVEAFGEDGAVERTVETFFEMKYNDLAYKLIQVKEPETSSAREKPREVDPTVLEDLSCSICLSLFTDPVMLQCGHSFCQSCVHKDWERNIVRECSLCKQVIPEGDPPINFSLKSLCENYRGRSQAEPSGHRNHTESFQNIVGSSVVEERTEQKSVADKTDEVIRESVSSIEALVHHFHPSCVAQGGSNVAAPNIIGCSIKNINIIISTASNIAVNHDTADTLQPQLSADRSQSPHK